MVIVAAVRSVKDTKKECDAVVVDELGEQQTANARSRLATVAEGVYGRLKKGRTSRLMLEKKRKQVEIVGELWWFKKERTGCWGGKRKAGTWMWMWNETWASEVHREKERVGRRRRCQAQARSGSNRGLWMPMGSGLQASGADVRFTKKKGQEGGRGGACRASRGKVPRVYGYNTYTT